MKELLVVIDMQNDFVTGSLGTKEACGIVDNVKNKIEEYVERAGDCLYKRYTYRAVSGNSGGTSPAGGTLYQRKQRMGADSGDPSVFGRPQCL